MDTKTLISEARARFSHNSTKIYLQEKYENKFSVAAQNGLWLADSETIGLLSAFDTDKLILIDMYDNPIEVNRLELLDVLKSVYQSAMKDWLVEFKELKNKR